MKKKLICHDGIECSIKPTENMKTVEIMGNKYKVPEECEKAPDGKCDGRIIVDYENCVDWCPICSGTGFIKYDLSIHDPEFGKLHECPNKPVTSGLLKRAGLTDQDFVLSWDSLRQTETLWEMKNSIYKLEEKGTGWLYIYGVPGNGKTSAAKLGLIQALRKKRKGKYMTHSEIVNWLRDSYSSDNSQQAYNQRMKELQELDFLVIDEMARDRGTDFAIQVLSDLIDKRYTNAVNGKGTTIFVSNFSPEEALDNYQADRIRDGRFTVINAKGNSQRAGMEK